MGDRTITCCVTAIKKTNIKTHKTPKIQQKSEFFSETFCTTQQEKEKERTGKVLK